MSVFEFGDGKRLHYSFFPILFGVIRVHGCGVDPVSTGMLIQTTIGRGEFSKSFFWYDESFLLTSDKLLFNFLVELADLFESLLGGYQIVAVLPEGVVVGRGECKVRRRANE